MSISDPEELGNDSVITQREVKRHEVFSMSHGIDKKLTLESDDLGSNPVTVSYKLCVLEQII